MCKTYMGMGMDKVEAWHVHAGEYASECVAFGLRKTRHGNDNDNAWPTKFRRFAHPTAVLGREACKRMTACVCVKVQARVQCTRSGQWAGGRLAMICGP